MTVPDSFEPEGGVRMNIMVMQMRIAMYKSTEGDGMLMFMGMESGMVSREDMEKELQKQMSVQKFGNENDKVTIRNSETRDFEIGGKTVPFQFSEGTRDRDGIPVRQVTATLNGNSSIVLFIMVVADENYDEQVVLDMIESMK